MNTVVTTNTEVVTTEVVQSTVVTQEQIMPVTIASKASDVVTQTQTENILQRVVETSVVVSGPQGPQGIQGDSTNFVTMVAGHTLGGNRVVCTDSFGLAVYPDLNAAFINIIGITTGAATIGNTVKVQICGFMTEPSWSFDITKSIFVGTDGILTQTEPTTGASCIIAEPVLSNKIFIDRQTIIWR